MALWTSMDDKETLLLYGTIDCRRANYRMIIKTLLLYGTIDWRRANYRMIRKLSCFMVQ